MEEGAPTLLLCGAKQLLDLARAETSGAAEAYAMLAARVLSHGAGQLGQLVLFWAGRWREAPPSCQAGWNAVIRRASASPLCRPSSPVPTRPLPQPAAWMRGSQQRTAALAPQQQQQQHTRLHRRMSLTTGRSTRVRRLCQRAGS